MRNITEGAGKKCPKCGKIENQIKAGYNAVGVLGLIIVLAPRINSIVPSIPELSGLFLSSISFSYSFGHP